MGKYSHHKNRKALRRFDSKAFEKSQRLKVLKQNRGFTDETKLLKYKIDLLQHLPKDFKDLVPGSTKWQDYVFAHGSTMHEKMSTWLNGPFLLTQDFNDAEIRYCKQRICFPCHTSFWPLTYANASFEVLQTLEQAAISYACSFIYLPQFQKGFVEDLNNIAKARKLPFRWKARLMGTNNLPLGEF